MKGIDLEKKLGPLPVWGWALLGGGTLGVVYYIRSRSSSSSTTAASTVDPNTIDPATGIPWSQEAATNAADAAAAGAGAGGITPTPPPAIDTSGFATGITSTDQLATQLAAIQQEISAQSTGALTNPSPTTTITGEATDLLAAQAALQSLGLGGTPTPTTGGTPAAKGKSIAGLTILQQLADVRAGVLTKAQLGPNAAKVLATANGNVNKAIAARQTPLVKAAKKPTTYVVPPKAASTR